MSREHRAQSILALDVGPSLTHGALLQPVEGAHRLIAHAETPTAASPEVDLVQSVLKCVRRLEQLAEQPLLGDDGVPLTPRSGRQSVDALVVTTNAAPPLTCAVVGLTQELSVQNGLAACRSSYARLGEVVRLSEGGDHRRQALTALRASPPDVIAMVGGVDAGPTGLLVEAAGLLATLFSDLEPGRRPTVIYAGNQAAHQAIAQALGASLDCRVVDNVMPSLHSSYPQGLQQELFQLYATRQLPRLAGYETLSRWACTPVLPTQAALATVLQYQSRQDGAKARVLGLDLGANHAFAALATEDYAWSQELRGEPAALGDAPLVSAIASTALAGLAEVADYAPDGCWSVDLIAARGEALAKAESLAWAALALVNAVSPLGATRLVLDWASLWPQLGALAHVEPLAALQVLERDACLDLGTVVSLLGPGRQGRQAARLRLISDTGPVVGGELLWGHLVRLPLPEGTNATLEVEPARGAARLVGLPRRIRVWGGRLGVIVDARGRPLPAPLLAAEGDQWQTWLAELG